MKGVMFLLMHVVAAAICLFFLYPLYWMFVNSFRTQAEVLSNPLRLLPESFDLQAYARIRQIGGVDLGIYVVNSVVITVGATVLAVAVIALGAYALVRNPKLPLFPTVRFGFLVTMMYPPMLLVIPVYLVMFQLGLLGSYVGVILFISVMPLLFLMFVEFFRSIPKELFEAAAVDGATELQILWKIAIPISRPILGTVFLIGFLLNWKQWLPILVISTSPNQYTLPVALLSLNTEYGVNFQSTMALAFLTTIPVIVVFLLTQRRIVSGLMAGSVKG
jgi:ABC-type glycerol-3-phosphate transport system permease component